MKMESLWNAGTPWRAVKRSAPILSALGFALTGCGGDEGSAQLGSSGEPVPSSSTTVPMPGSDGTSGTSSPPTVPTDPQPAAPAPTTGMPGEQPTTPGAPSSPDTPGMPPPGMEDPEPMTPPAPAEPPVPGAPACAASYGPAGMELTDPSCDDGKYCEVLPDLTADVVGLYEQLSQATDTPERAKLAFDILEKSYPYGAVILRGASPECHAMWLNNEQLTNIDPITAAIDVSVHECGHGFDFATSAYQVSEGVSYPMVKKEYFNRLEIKGDQFDSAIEKQAADHYFTADGVGAQGIVTMFSEWTQYNHNIAMLYARSVYERDDFAHSLQQAMNFAWNGPRYLHWAKTKYPSDYAEMLADEKIRTIVLGLFGQSMLLYDAYAKDTGWTPGEEHSQYVEQLRNPELKAIMNEVRQAHGCSGLR